jgi:hypothetical protein
LKPESGALTADLGKVFALARLRDGARLVRAVAVLASISSGSIR